MLQDYATLSHIALAPGSSYLRPDRVRFLPLDAPAMEVMTDFKQVWPATIAPDVAIDDALERMKSAGVRMLLVVEPSQEIVGLVTANDIQGERPVQLVHDEGLTRGDITVARIMVPAAAIDVVSMTAVRNARIGHLVATLREVGRQHMLVVDVHERTGAQAVRGVISSSDIGKRLGRDVGELMSGAHSLVELSEAMARAG